MLIIRYWPLPIFHLHETGLREGKGVGVDGRHQYVDPVRQPWASASRLSKMVNAQAPWVGLSYNAQW